MNFSAYIAKRYLFSKKNSKTVNIISYISSIGFGVGSFSLIVILSVYNGFESLVLSLYNTFDADLRIESVEGKTFSLADIPMDKIKSMKDVLDFTPVIEENAALQYEDKQTIVFVKGMDEKYLFSSGMDSLIIDGELLLEDEEISSSIVGYGVAHLLSIDVSNYSERLSIYVPKRGVQGTVDPTQALSRKSLYCSGIFSVDDNINNKYIVTSYDFARQLMDYPQNTITAFEIRLKPNSEIENTQKEIEKILNKKLVLKTKYQLQESLYKVFNTEKWATYFILSFILVIAAFNIVGTLTMLVLEKEKDISTLQSMGATHKGIVQIFFRQGIYISLIGSFIGLFIGLILCFVQQEFGLLKIQNGDLQTLVVSAYPIKLVFNDTIKVLITNVLLGVLVSFVPYFIIKKYK